jgi:hypothetical protein
MARTGMAVMMAAAGESRRERGERHGDRGKDER